LQSKLQQVSGATTNSVWCDLTCAVWEEKSKRSLSFFLTDSQRTRVKAASADKGQKHRLLIKAFPYSRGLDVKGTLLPGKSHILFIYLFFK